MSRDTCCRCLGTSQWCPRVAGLHAHTPPVGRPERSAVGSGGDVSLMLAPVLLERHVLASWLALTFMSSSRNLAGSSRWGVCADNSNHTSCLLGAVRES